MAKERKRGGRTQPAIKKRDWRVGDSEREEKREKGRQ